jgi:hypothetical protein
MSDAPFVKRLGIGQKLDRVERRLGRETKGKRPLRGDRDC